MKFAADSNTVIVYFQLNFILDFFFHDTGFLNTIMRFGGSFDDGKISEERIIGMGKPQPFDEPKYFPLFFPFMNHPFEFDVLNAGGIIQGCISFQFIGDFEIIIHLFVIFNERTVFILGF